MVSTCMWVVRVAAGCVCLGWIGDGCTGGRCGGHGCGRNAGSDGRCGRSKMKYWMAHFVVLSNYLNCDRCGRKRCWRLVRLWWHPYLLKYNRSNLSCCLFLILSCRCSLILLMNNLALSKTWSCNVSETEICAVLVVWLERISLNLTYCSTLCLSSVVRIPLMFLIHS